MYIVYRTISLQSLSETVLQMRARVILIHKHDRELIMVLPRCTIVVTVIFLRIVTIVMLKPASEADLLYSFRCHEYNLRV
jgi:hypothetical protein